MENSPKEMGQPFKTLICHLLSSMTSIRCATINCGYISIVLLWQSWCQHNAICHYPMGLEKHGRLQLMHSFTLPVNSSISTTLLYFLSTAVLYMLTYQPMLLPCQSALILEERYQRQQRRCWTSVKFWVSCVITEMHQYAGLSYTNQQ